MTGDVTRGALLVPAAHTHRLSPHDEVGIHRKSKRSFQLLCSCVSCWPCRLLVSEIDGDQFPRTVLRTSGAKLIGRRHGQNEKRDGAATEYHLLPRRSAKSHTSGLVCSGIWHTRPGVGRQILHEEREARRRQQSYLVLVRWQEGKSSHGSRGRQRRQD